MLNTRYQFDKIIITAMDRFVWFVLLVVTTHLVTEFTKTTNGGYTKTSSTSDDAITSNDIVINTTYKTDDSEREFLWPDMWAMVRLHKQQVHMEQPILQQHQQLQLHLPQSTSECFVDHQQQQQQQQQQYHNYNHNYNYNHNHDHNHYHDRNYHQDHLSILE